MFEMPGELEKHLPSAAKAELTFRRYRDDQRRALTIHDRRHRVSSVGFTMRAEKFLDAAAIFERFRAAFASS